MGFAGKHPLVPKEYRGRGSHEEGNILSNGTCGLGCGCGNYICFRDIEHPTGCFLFGSVVNDVMAKGKYEQWLTKEGLTLLEGWARDGLTDEQISHNMGVSRSTLSEWKKKYTDISDTLKKGKEVVDRHVENALLKRALGYNYEEVTHEHVWNKKTEKYELSVTKVVTKQVAPDTTAAIFWLKNRKSDWSNKEAVDLEKTKAEIEFIEERTKLIRGEKKDTSLLDELIQVVNSDD